MIETTVVGSYPVRVSREALMRAYFSTGDAFIDSIRDAVGDQLFAGIDILSTGQVRTDMISEFTKNLSGLVIRDGTHYVIAPIKHRGPIGFDDLVLTRRLIPKGKKIKSPLTGPYTLTKSCQITEDSGYKTEEELAFDFARALNLEARIIQEHSDIIQIDEPEFSQNLPDYARELIDIVREGIEKSISLHVCGDVSNIFETLASYKVDILDHEFASNPDLLERVASVEASQRIGYGCVQSHNHEIESVEDIARDIEKAMKTLGEERIMLDPDCGLRHLPRDIAYQKLANMVEARNSVYGVETVRARKKPLNEDDWDLRGYFYIFLNKQRGKIRAEHYSYDHVVDSVVEGTLALSMLDRILDGGLISRETNGLRHFGYVATELQKAETALRNNLDYTQDKKLDLTSKVEVV